MRAALLIVLLALTGCASPGGPPSLPDAVAVLGDSISRAAAITEADGNDHPRNSWATGTDGSDGVTSHLERLRALQPGREIVGFNNARSGAPVADLARQAEDAVRQRAPYVLVLFGANDACAPSVEAMTSEAEFRARLDEGLDVLGGLPRGAVVYLVSVPDVTQLRELFADNETARATWSAFRACPSALAGESGDAARERIAAYNRALEEEASARRYHWDGGRAFAQRYRAEDVSPYDYFHPSAAGQARLAEATWEAGPFGASEG